MIGSDMRQRFRGITWDVDTTRCGAGLTVDEHNYRMVVPIDGKRGKTKKALRDALYCGLYAAFPGQEYSVIESVSDSMAEYLIKLGYGRTD
jgi:hypothetical protein